ncbi:MAG TPA: hypothetical protein VM243_06615 [Phycisphaerae bacterium]|nr:hypothetical protein [Phycisphaerae bacterium]
MDVSAPLLVQATLAHLADSSTGLTNSQIVLILLIIGTSALMLISARRRMRRSANSPQAYTREQRTRIRDEESLVQEMEQAMARLEEVAQEVQGRIDTRFAKLESVIRDADQRIDHLERLLRSTAGEPTIDRTVGDVAEPGGPSTDTATDDPRYRVIFDRADAGRTPLQIAEETGQSTGEVELILALRPPKSVANA